MNLEFKKKTFGVVVVVFGVVLFCGGNHSNHPENVISFFNSSYHFEYVVTKETHLHFFLTGGLP